MDKFQVDYAFPGASGYVVRELVTVGNISPALMPVGVATKIGPFLVDQPFDGVLGLAFKSMNTSWLFSFFSQSKNLARLISEQIRLITTP